MDLEVFDNNTENSTFDPNENYAFDVNYYLEVPTFIVATLSSIANALMILMIIRFRVLHTTSYFYLANWCICNFGITILTHSTFTILGISEMVSATTLCIWFHVVFAFMFGNLLFVFVLILNWYIVTFSSQGYCALKCRRYYKIFAAIIYILLLILLVKSVLYCLKFVSIPLLILLSCLAYFLVTILIFIISILRMIKLRTSSIVVEKSNIEFKIALSHFLCWLPNILLMVVHIVIHLHITLQYICQIIWYSNACVVFLLLYFNDSDFKTCLGTLFNIKVNVSQKENKDIPLINV